MHMYIAADESVCGGTRRSRMGGRKSERRRIEQDERSRRDIFDPFGVAGLFAGIGERVGFSLRQAFRAFRAGEKRLTGTIGTP